MLPRITEYESCERLSGDIQSKLVLRNREPKLSTEYTRISNDIRLRLKQYSTEVRELNTKLGIAVRQKTV